MQFMNTRLPNSHIVQTHVQPLPQPIHLYWVIWFCWTLSYWVNFTHNRGKSIVIMKYTSIQTKLRLVFCISKLDSPCGSMDKLISVTTVIGVCLVLIVMCSTACICCGPRASVYISGKARVPMVWLICSNLWSRLTQ